MEELITALKEILEAEANGGELDGIVINDEENVLPEAVEKPNAQGQLPMMITISEVQETFEVQESHYELAVGEVDLAIITPVMKKEQNKWRSAKNRLKPITKKLRKVIMSNQKLACNSYPNGIIYQPRNTKIESVVYGYSSIGSIWYCFARCRLKTKYLYRNYQISLT